MPLGDSQALPKIHTMFLGKAKAGENVQVKAAALLITSGALVELSAADAREVVGYMRPELVKAGQVVIREGESTRNDFMALVLDGEVTVENSVAAAHDDAGHGRSGNVWCEAAAGGFDFRQLGHGIF